MNEIRDLALLIDAGLPIIAIETYEETRALQVLSQLAVQRATSLYSWTVTDGIRRTIIVGQSSSLTNTDTSDPESALQHLKQQSQAGLIVLCDFHHYLNGQPRITRLLKDIALNAEHSQQTLILLSHELNIPKDIERLTVRFSLTLPSESQLMRIIHQEAQQWSANNCNKHININDSAITLLAKSMRGLSLDEAKRLARGAIVDDGAISESDIDAINRAKFALMNMDSVLSYEYDTEKFSDVAGFKRLKHWLKLREDALHNDEHQLDTPKGLLLLGVQGAGKSLAAKAIAGFWKVPLLRLDIGNLYNKYIGESERNLQQALAQADVMAPCVLWIDELEKGIAQGRSDDGVSKRLLGTLLTWMAERQSPVFMVATSNNIDILPPELVRKGRFDEIFFVDLPGAEIRQQILLIHMNKRGIDHSQLQVDRLVAISEGFSGAEIEQALVSALYRVRHIDQHSKRDEDGEHPLLQTIIERELNTTKPLSITMAEPIYRLRSWAEERCVFVD